jgi:twitching motility two-component system response regulator PilG
LGTFTADFHDSERFLRSLLAPSGRQPVASVVAAFWPIWYKSFCPVRVWAYPGNFYGVSGVLEWARELGRVLIGRGNPVSDNASRSLSGLKILVVDDSKTIRRTAETLLSKEGCQVFTAIDGFDALSKIADHQPDLIFVDIMMPRLDGYQTCSLIKHNKVFKETPVIMLSSKDGLFDRARGRIVGSEQYLTKPFTKDELLGAISNQIN